MNLFHMSFAFICIVIAIYPSNATSEINIVMTCCLSTVCAHDCNRAVKSVVLNYGWQRPLCIWIIWDKSPAIQKEFLQILKDEMQKSLQGYPVKLHAVPDFPIPKEYDMWRRCASQRIFLPDRYDMAGLDAVLYLDSDVVVLEDIQNLWDMFDLFHEQQLVGMAEEAVENESHYTKWYSNKKSCKTCRRFFGKFGLNSGVMLMNLTRIRNSNFHSEILNSLKVFSRASPFKRYSGKSRMIHREFVGDQDAYNQVLFYYPRYVFVLPCKWNKRSDDYCRKDGSSGILHGNRGIFHDNKRTRRKWRDSNPSGYNYLSFIQPARYVEELDWSMIISQTSVKAWRAGWLQGLGN
mmetsp:Transcript_54137/g.171791  ORF Transcript_54137/g.171791 Transcript_54137/m.171791 type:complete len:350 (-) Transcript_54137:93-1142(-)